MLIDSGFKAKLERALERLPEETTRAVMDCTFDLAGKSANLAPIETGDLRNNCVAVVDGKVTYENQMQVTDEVKPSLKPSGSVGYSLPYALRQHEDLTLNHDKTNGKVIAETIRYTTQDGKVSTIIGRGSYNRVAGGQAKFLEQPYKESKQLYIKRFEEIFKKVLE